MICIKKNAELKKNVHWPVVPSYHYEFCIIILEIYLSLLCYKNNDCIDGNINIPLDILNIKEQLIIPLMPD